MCVRWRNNASPHCCSTRHRRNIQRSRGQHQNRGMGVTKAQYIDASMDFMEKTGVFNTVYKKQFEAAANVLQDDGSKQMCRLKQTCTPKGAARNIWLLSLMWWSWIMQLVSTWLVWDPMKYPGRVALQIVNWQSSFTSTRQVVWIHVGLT